VLEGDGAAHSCECASYQDNGIIHLRVSLRRHDGRPYCTSRIAFVANFNGTFVSLGRLFVYTSLGPIILSSDHSTGRIRILKYRFRVSVHRI